MNISPLEYCKREIIKKMNAGDVFSWSNQEFGKLQKAIFDASGVKISIQTLMRLFRGLKVTNDSLPPGTRDAMSKYLGYSDWGHFVSQLSSEQETKGNIFKRMFMKNPVSRYVLVIFLLLLFFLVMYYKMKDEKKDVLFYAEENVGYHPFIGKFHYEIPSKQGYRIKYSPKSMEQLVADQQMITYQFPFPDYYTVQLLNQRNVCIATENIHVLSNGWFGKIKSGKAHDDNYKHIFIRQDKLIHEGMLYLPPALIASRGIDTSHYYYTQFRLSRKFDIMADHMTLKTRVLNKYRVADIESAYFMINFHTEHATNSIYFSAPCCYNSTRQKVGTTDLKGKYHDHSMFGQDLLKWSDIQLAIASNKVDVFFNQQKIYTIPYKGKLGELKSLIIEFTGSGQMDYLKIIDEQNKHNSFIEEFDR